MSRLLLPAAALLATTLLSGCGRSLPPYEKPIARTTFQRVRTTAYTHTESDHLEHGRHTCLGTTLRCGTVNSAAADWSRWPAGTTFRILETGELYEVDDIGWALSGRNTIDLYKPSKSAMNRWGVQTVNLEILKWGEDRESYGLLAKRRKYRHVARMLDGLQTRIARGETNPPSAALLATAQTASIPAAVSVAPIAGTLSPSAASATLPPQTTGGLRRPSAGM
jgi:3D (Asp-Asp-Asp) domain-containing protein